MHCRKPECDATPAWELTLPDGRLQYLCEQCADAAVEYFDHEPDESGAAVMRRLDTEGPTDGQEQKEEAK